MTSEIVQDTQESSNELQQVPVDVQETISQSMHEKPFQSLVKGEKLLSEEEIEDKSDEIETSNK